jgi:hypothetical protein
MRWWFWCHFWTRPTYFLDLINRLFGLDQQNFDSTCSLKQQSLCRPVVPLWRIILIPSQPIFSLNPQCCMLSTEAANINFIVFGLTRMVTHDTPLLQLYFSSSSEDKQRFLTYLSHSFFCPLNAIMVLIDINTSSATAPALA